MPRISVVIPTHDMPNKEVYLQRSLDALWNQTFQDFEVVVSDNSDDDILENVCDFYKTGIRYFKNPRKGMAVNTNKAIKEATGDVVKLLQLDDFLSDPNALSRIVFEFDRGAQWLIHGCVHTVGGVEFFDEHIPRWNDEIYGGNNTLGGLSTLAFLRGPNPLLEEPLTWIVDCDLYMEFYRRFGEPTLIKKPLVAVQLGLHQTTNTLSDREKAEEVGYLLRRYSTNNLISQQYERCCSEDSDIYEHLPTLKRLAANCSHVTEMGVRFMVSTWALLEGLRPRGGKLVGIDIVDPRKEFGLDIDKIRDECKKLGVDFEFNVADTTKIEIEPTDLLFIDTLHTGEQLSKELELHADKAKKYIVFHDTISCKRELWPVVTKFLEDHSEWEMEEHYKNNNGLTVIRRI